MKHAAYALVAREWGIVRRPAQLAVGLVTLGTGLFFVMCAPADRYRLLADTAFLRSLLLPAPLLLGGALAWISFAREMRQGTWDGWILLPQPRWLLVGSKIVVGSAATVGVAAIPTLLLYLTLRAWGEAGGPSISLADLAFRSAASQGVLVGLLSYFAAANAWLLGRTGRVGFFAPPTVPVFAALLFAQESSGRYPAGLLRIALALAIVAFAGSLFVEIGTYGRRTSPLELSLSAIAVTPPAALVLLLACLVGTELGSRWARPALAPPAVIDAKGIDSSGRIVRKRNRTFVPMTQVTPTSKLERATPERVWTPAYVDRHWQMFRRRDANAFSVFSGASGAYLGCLGASGLGADDRCTPFDGVPHVLQTGTFAAIVSDDAVHILHRGEVRELLRGSVHGGAYLGTIEDNEQDLLALAVGADVAIVSLPRDDEETRPPSLSWCHDAVRGGFSLAGIARRNDFIAMESETPGGSRELAVCRDGVVRERAMGDPVEPASPSRFAIERERVIAFVVGSVASAFIEHHRALRSARDLDGEAPSSPPQTMPPSSYALLGGGAAMLLLLVLTRGRARWAAAPALVLGPGYALAYLLVRWQRPALASWLA